ncbi:MAG: GntR family transcriptional regulator [Alphaproteobacteria bacterium]|nr:GntR family transcriptional regulator [Alphaproteobacteria bacterium]
MPSPSHSPYTDASGPAAEAVGALGVPAFSPLYQQIKGLILQSLQSGEWKPGEVILSENDLAARYRVSQGTVRKAIDELSSEHLLVRRQGKGTFVATHAEQQVQYRFLRLMPDPGQEHLTALAERRMIDCKRVRASAELARLLGLRAGDALIQVRRVLAFGGVPTILEDIWLPGSSFKGLTLERLQDWRGPMYAMFESEFGVRMVRAQEQVRAVMPDPTQAEWLELAGPTPLLNVERVAYTYNDAPMEVRRGLYRTDRHHYFNTLN